MRLAPSNGELHWESGINLKALLSRLSSSTGRARANPYLRGKLGSRDLLATFCSGCQKEFAISCAFPVPGMVPILDASVYMRACVRTSTAPQQIRTFVRACPCLFTSVWVNRENNRATLYGYMHVIVLKFCSSFPTTVLRLPTRKTVLRSPRSDVCETKKKKTEGRASP